MKVLNVYNPDQALDHGLIALLNDGATCDSRNGPVIRFRTPVTSVYFNPRQRVSFNPIRDANPFLHLMEALWMLAGRNDVEFAGYYAKQMFEYSDDGHTLNAAYGYRWRHHFGFDQLAAAIDILKADPNSRQVVIQMWDPADLLKKTKDKACNTSVMFDAQLGFLDMTITNRSNDTIWGAYGANVVHFSLLQEYVANRTGLPIGTYYQVSNNLHVYTDFEISKRFITKTENGFSSKTLAFTSEDNMYGRQLAESLTLGADHPTWDEELQHLVTNYRSLHNAVEYVNPFFSVVAAPMRTAYNLWKNGERSAALKMLDQAQDRYVNREGGKLIRNDWLYAGQQWMVRRLAKDKV